MNNANKSVKPMKKNPKRAKLKLAKKILVTAAKETLRAHINTVTPKQKTGDKNHNRFELDLTEIAEHSIININNFKEFLLEHIKKMGNSKVLVNNITFEQEDMKLFVICNRSVAKRTIKFYIKKYLKKNKLRDWIHVVANKPESYQFKYISISA